MVSPHRRTLRVPRDKSHVRTVKASRSARRIWILLGWLVLRSSRIDSATVSVSTLELSGVNMK